MTHGLARIGLAMGLAAILPSCFGTAAGFDRSVGPVALAFPFDGTDDLRPHVRSSASPTASPAVVVLDRGSVMVRGFHEPGDFAHRNYCGAGATQVLLSAWMAAVPDIETVARRSRLNPGRGEFGADAQAGINSLLASIVDPAIGHSWYRAEHVTTLAGVEARIRSDILDPDAIRVFGHGAPLIVQTMTRTMPGWSRWNATHMITIFAFDFSHHDPAQDTVSYAETPSPLAGYRGPDFRTISVSALWIAMSAYNREYPIDPMNVIW